jgi:hypothetical protein
MTGRATCHAAGHTSLFRSAHGRNDVTRCFVVASAQPLDVIVSQHPHIRHLEKEMAFAYSRLYFLSISSNAYVDFLQGTVGKKSGERPFSLPQKLPILYFLFSKEWGKELVAPTSIQTTVWLLQQGGSACVNSTGAQRQEAHTCVTPSRINSGSRRSIPNSLSKPSRAVSAQEAKEKCWVVR